MCRRPDRVRPDFRYRQRARTTGCHRSLPGASGHGNIRKAVAVESPTTPPTCRRHAGKVDCVNHVPVCAVERSQIEFSRKTTFRFPSAEDYVRLEQGRQCSCTSRGRQVEVVDAVAVDVAQRLSWRWLTVRAAFIRDPVHDEAAGAIATLAGSSVLSSKSSPTTGGLPGVRPADAGGAVVRVCEGGSRAVSLPDPDAMWIERVVCGTSCVPFGKVSVWL